MAEQVREREKFLADLLSSLQRYLTKLKANGGQGFMENYARLGALPSDLPSSVSREPANVGKNRYRNIPAYDHSRVVLKGGDGDYINGNWIAGFHKPKGYIATQGPIPASFNDFWRMIWQENARVIIQVTREVEAGQLKCHRYWPDPTSDPPTPEFLFDEVFVKHISTTPQKFFVIRTFEVSKGAEVRTVQQFAYEAWPDHGVPLTTFEFLSFRQAVKTAAAPFDASPIVIHCSAGVGRTGTFICVDRILDAAYACERSSALDVDSVITEMRQARNFMVQTDSQYMFCFEAVLDGIRVLLADANRDAWSQELQASYEAVAKERAEREASEAAEVATLMRDAKQREKLSAAAATTSAEEAKAAEAQWEEARKEGVTDEYDISRTLTTLQSRIEALAQIGVDLTPATSSQLKKLIEANRFKVTRVNGKKVSDGDSAAAAAKSPTRK